jgi:hypothetical protein
MYFPPPSTLAVYGIGLTSKLVRIVDPGSLPHGPHLYRYHRTTWANPIHDIRLNRGLIQARQSEGVLEDAY